MHADVFELPAHVVLDIHVPAPRLASRRGLTGDLSTYSSSEKKTEHRLQWSTMYLYSPYYSAIDLPRCLWSLLNRFRASQGRCLATSTGGVWPYQVGLCTYNQRQTMINHIIYMRPLTI